MILHTRRLPHQAEWYMFAFDNNYIFVERLVKELSKFDAHLPIYTILRDSNTDVSLKTYIFSSTVLFSDSTQTCLDTISLCFEYFL